MTCSSYYIIIIRSMPSPHNPTCCLRPFFGFPGRGLRTLVARTCTGFVRIPGGGGGMAGDSIGGDDGETRSGVDSLNVSVTGGILLWHFLSRQ